MNSSKVLLGFVAGAAVGALAGILFAPDKGCNTRKMISNKAQDWTDAAKESFSDLMDGVKNVYSGVKDEAEDVADKTKAKMAATKNEMKNEVRSTFS